MTMSATALSTAHDLIVTGGAIARVFGRDAIAQSIRTRLLLFRGEYFLDIREGVPYYQEVLIKRGFELGRIEEIFRDEIRKVPGVIDVPTCIATLERGTRKVTVWWVARTADGLVDSKDRAPAPVLVFDTLTTEVGDALTTEAGDTLTSG